MQVHKSYVSDFMSEGKRLLIIPPYQRRYSWTLDNCRQLFNDILNSAETSAEHFMGTICYKITGRSHFIIVDGQQRLTSFSLFLRALKECTSLDEDIDRCLYNSGRGFEDFSSKIRLHLSPDDNEAWQRILSSGCADGDTRLDAAFNLFMELILTQNTPEALWDAIENMTFIELEIQDENPQEVFESLNSTGLALTDADRIRNFMLMGADDQEHLYRARWQPIEKAMGAELDSFLVHFLADACRSATVSANLTINKGNLYRAWKLWMDGRDRKDVLDAMYEYMQYYRDLIDEKWENEPFSVFHATDARVVLAHINRLLAHNKITQEEAQEGKAAVASYIMRSRVCGTSKIKLNMATTIVRRVKGHDFMETLWSALTEWRGTLTFPTDSEFMNALMGESLFPSIKSAGVKYLLYALEKNGPFPRGLPDFYNGDVTIEHISPQTITPEWEQTSLTQCLGNLALTSENSRMSNRSFDEKRPFYANEKFFLTRQVAEYSSWKDANIRLRGRQLAEQALKVWPLPKKYQKMKTADAYPITSMKKFAHTKPLAIDIAGTSRKISSWSEMLPTVIEILREFDEGPVARLLEERNDVAPVKKDGYTKCGDVFINTRRGADATVRATQRFAHSFDELAGTDYEDRIRFMLR